MKAGQSTGYLQIIGEGGSERDVLSCKHCQRQVVIAPAKGASSQRIDRCGQCHATICHRCAAELASSMKCSPFEKRLEAMEHRGETLRRILG